MKKTILASAIIFLSILSVSFKSPSQSADDVQIASDSCEFKLTKLQREVADLEQKLKAAITEADQQRRIAEQHMSRARENELLARKNAQLARESEIKAQESRKIADEQRRLAEERAKELEEKLKLKDQ